MLKESLVYIRERGGGDAFVGCGAYIEENLIVTCRHVWRDAGDDAEVVFPHVKRRGSAATSKLILIDHCQNADGNGPDLVLLRATDPPDGATELQIARSEALETGKARALAWLPTRHFDDEIPGEIGSHIGGMGRRSFRQSQADATGYWLEEGSSGSPVFILGGQQLAGIISMAELGDKPHTESLRVARLVPSTIILPFVQAVAKRERRSGGDTANFERDLTDANASEGGVHEIDVFVTAGKRNALLERLRTKIREDTRVSGPTDDATEADREFLQWERIEAERRAEAVAEGVRILGLGAAHHVRRGNYRAAAESYARMIDLENPDSSTWLAALRAKQNEFYEEGRDKGINAALEIAIELGRLELEARK